jgi:hypothetical protein
VPPLPCYNTTRCPCTNETTFLMADSGTDANGKVIDPNTLRSGYYSNWPVFPAEHLDADTGGVDGADLKSSAMSMFVTSPTSLAVIDLPAGVRMSAGQAAKPFDIVEPGAYPVPVLKGINDWLLWSTTNSRPGSAWAKDGARGNLFPFITPAYAGGVEEIGVTMNINDMLLLSTGGASSDGISPLNMSNAILRLFPVWRYAAGAGPAQFAGLRAKGAFVVTASYDNVTDEVSGVNIVSDVGNRCSVLSPWSRATGPGSVHVINRAKAEAVEAAVTWRKDSRGHIFSFDTMPGGTYDVVPSP